LFGILIIITNVRGEACDPVADACSMDGFDVLQIFCDHHENTACVCTAEADGACTTIDDDVSGLFYNTLKIEKCEELCLKQAGEDGKADPVLCSRWQWKSDEYHNGEDVTCTMRSTPCPGPDFCFGETIECASGHINCGQDTTPTTPKPLVDCQGKIQYQSSLVHWDCRYPNKTSINAYVEEIIPGGVECQTMERCIEWDEPLGTPIPSIESREDSYSYKLVVVCNGDTGLWEPSEHTGDMKITESLITDPENEKNTILEADLDRDCDAKCASTQLDKDEMTDRGVEVICDQSIEFNEYVLEGDNSCILMCDREIQKQIECLFDLESNKGEKTWYDTVMPNPNEGAEEPDYSGPYFKYSDPEKEFKCDWEF